MSPSSKKRRNTFIFENKEDFAFYGHNKKRLIFELHANISECPIYKLHLSCTDSFIYALNPRSVRTENNYLSNWLDATVGIGH